MLNEPTIIWEKWVDPYGQNMDSIEWPGYDNNNEEEMETIKYEKINAIATSMGIIPYNEHTDCTKIFNFWVGHTNFNLSKYIVEKLQLVDGVETLDIFTRYRFRISFGKAFNERDIINSINNSIKEIFHELNSRTKIN